MRVKGFLDELLTIVIVKSIQPTDEEYELMLRLVKKSYPRAIKYIDIKEPNILVPNIH